MNAFKQSLQRFLTGEATFAQLQADLDIELALNPADAPKYLDLVTNLYSAGRLPQQLFDPLSQQIQRVAGLSAGAPPPAGAPAAPPPSTDQSTAPAPGTAPGPAAPEPGSPPGATPTQADDKTRFRPAEDDDEDDDDDRTRLRPAGPATQTSVTGQHPPPTGTQPTGQSWTSGQSGLTAPTGHTVQTGQTGQTSATGQPPTGQSWTTGGSASSGWAHPERWAGADGGVPTVGSVLKGRFVLEHVIGQGGMGIVFKAKDLRKEEAQDRNPYIAVKILNEEFKQHPESLKALQRESRKAQDLAHPNIVTVFDFDRDAGNVFMTMEYLDGEPFDKFLKRHTERGLPFDKGLPLIRDMAAGLSYAHERGIIHSDFKPANAYLTKQGVVKIFDFGIARAAKHSDQAGGEMTLFDAGTLGALTPAYATVSMVEGGDPDVRDDIYALACVSYQVLTGQHPYRKRSALKARNAGMEVEPVEGLNRRQWRTMQRALSYEREDQPPSVEEFIDGLEPKAINKTQLAAGALVVILLIVILVTWLPGYMNERYLNNLIQTLEAGSDAEIAEILTELETELDDAERATVYLNVLPSGLALEEFFERNVYSAIAWRAAPEPDPDSPEVFNLYSDSTLADWRAGVYDFATAESLVERAEVLYPERYGVRGDLRRNLDGARDDAIAELNRRFVAATTEGRRVLIPMQGVDNALEYREVLATLEPQHESVVGELLLTEIKTEIEAALQAENLSLGVALVEAGVSIAPGDSGLQYWQDQVASQVAAFENAQRVASLAAILAPLAQTRDINEIRQATTNIEELLRLEPDNAVGARVLENLETMLADRVAGLARNRQFEAARNELESVANLLTRDYLSAQQARIDGAQAEFNTAIDDALGEIQRLAQSGDFAPPNQGLARSRLDQLQSLGASDEILELARQSVKQGYLDAARAARGAQRFDDARSLVSLGLEWQTDGPLTEFLEQELSDIDNAERSLRLAADAAEAQRLAAERQQQIDSLVAEFETGIANPGLTVEEGRRLTNTVSRLQGLGDTGAIVRNGRARIGEALIGRAQMLAANGDWDAARSLVAETRSLLPQDRNVVDYAAQLERDFRNFEAGEAERALASARQSYDTLIAASRVDRDWLDQVWQLRSQLSADTQFRTRSEQQIAARLEEEIARLAAADRLTDARNLLNRGIQVLTNDQLLTSADRSLVAAEQAFADREAASAALARFEARKQTILDQIDAGSFSTANSGLSSIRSEIDANDSFLTDIVPRRFADAYVDQALAQVRSGNFDNALSLLSTAESYVSGYPPIEDVRQRINDARAAEAEQDEAARQAEADRRARADSLTSTLQAQLVGTAQVDAADVQGTLDEIRRLSPGDYNERVASLVGASISALESLQATNRSGARQRLAELQAVFPNEQRLANYTIATRPTSPGDDACGNPAFIGLGANSRAVCRDPLWDGASGPRMVVIPGTGPGGRPYAITKYEITIADYNTYCRLSGACIERGDLNALPLTNISLTEARAYAAWLSESTGFDYRLPSSAEWQYAAQAPGMPQPPRNYNCQIRDDSGLIKGLQLEDVRTGDANGWGLQNYVGNAREWVTDGSAVYARGGSYQDSFSACDISLTEQHSGQPDGVTGFRLVRNIRGQG